MMWWGDGYLHGGWWVMLGMGLLWVLLIATTIAALISILTSTRRDTHAPGTPGDRLAPPSRARAILEERYARGDISTEEYLERVSHLET